MPRPDKATMRDPQAAEKLTLVDLNLVQATKDALAELNPTHSATQEDVGEIFIETIPPQEQNDDENEDDATTIVDEGN